MDVLSIIEKLERMPISQPIRDVYCPNCGSIMIKRKSRPGLKSKYWYGCGSYPKCRSIVLDINLKEKHFINNF
jgi:ssDNA-binding Zn-finger/Zn-ribbon topoisomerase 1